jgi:uncharacterized protein (TIGR00290 family)
MSSTGAQYFMNWSGGKDSALALHAVLQRGLPLTTLLTSVNEITQRVSMHGVRTSLIQQQAAALGLPLRTISLSETPGMQAYEEAVQRAHGGLKGEGFSHGVFGDIFLEDLRQYRQDLLAKDGLLCEFPLWKRDSGALMAEFFAAGFKAIVVCINSAVLDKRFCGRLLDAAFLADLPPGVDPCGENGEYHSFVFDGPIFSSPVDFDRGEVVYKEYPAPKRGDDCFGQPAPASGFYFLDLLPRTNK